MDTKTLSLTFYGGVGSVTGANFLLEKDGKKILVDCGLVQGETRNRINFEPFPYDPAGIDTLLVTHAHIDHIGRIPRLVRKGFRGAIYSTPSTKELSEISYEDSVGILEEEARERGEKPLYDARDVARALSLWKTAPYYAATDIGGGVSCTFTDAGHILGSSMITITDEGSGKNIVFTGDLGNSPAPLLRDTDIVRDADYLVMESVYGDRNHEPKDDRTAKLWRIIKETIARGGVLMIPAFSIERTQVLLYEINNLIEDGGIPSVPVFLDSPFAIKATAVYRKHIEQFKKGVQEEIRAGDDIFNFPRLTFTKTAKESKRINDVPPPKIIIAGSGMSEGGRILHHERRYLSDPKNTLLLVGYQAVGSAGRKIEDGAKSVILFKDEIPVRARVASLRAYSSHKDSDHLVEFVSHTAERVKKVFVVMGEPKASLFLVQRLRDYLGIDATAPEPGARVTL